VVHQPLTVFGIETEDGLNAFSTATATIAAHFSFMGRIASWVAGKGIPELQAREYVACMFAGLADNDLGVSTQSFEDLAAAHATPGGLNEQVLRDLTDRGVFQFLTEALDVVHRRAAGHAGGPYG
jgi:pyrroline-5-carboxylate reductase